MGKNIENFESEEWKNKKKLTSPTDSSLKTKVCTNLRRVVLRVRSEKRKTYKTLGSHFTP